MWSSILNEEMDRLFIPQVILGSINVSLTVNVNFVNPILIFDLHFSVVFKFGPES